MAKSRFPKQTNGKAGIPPVEAASATLTTAEKNAAEITQPEPNKPARKPAIVKTSESRANIVPINLDDEIRRLAYLMSERRGFEPGHDTEDWLSAEHEIRQRYRQQSA